MTSLPHTQRSIVICLVLTIATLAVYGQSLRFEFVAYDDDTYVTKNNAIHNGLSLASVTWAFTTNHGGNWHPVAWISHAIDCQLFQLNPHFHHLTNILLHITNTLLLFSLLQRMTTRSWPSALVAALFAWHPLHVESVIWIAERKDLLSTTFGLLTISAYLSYVYHGRAWRYVTTVALMAIGLMAKPMLVTLPFVLFLLDYWPLDRISLGKALPIERTVLIRPRSPGWLCLEKIPLIILSITSSVLTYTIQNHHGYRTATDVLPLDRGVANAFVSYIRYLGKMFWPTDLSVLYPHPYLAGGQPWKSWQIGAAGIVLLAIFAIVTWAHRHRYLTVGWLWFIGMLVPVIGFVQVGMQAMADRYTYLPLTGLFIMIAWGLSTWFTLLQSRKIVKTGAVVLAVGILIACITVSFSQTRHWRNSVTLFTHALKVTPENAIIHYNLGTTFKDQNKPGRAIMHFQEALTVNPNFLDAHLNLGGLLIHQGQINRAISHFNKVLEINPNSTDGHHNMAIALQAKGQIGPMVQHLQHVVRLTPLDAAAQLSLAIALANTGYAHEATFHFDEAKRLRPNWVNPLMAEAEILLTGAVPSPQKQRRAVDLIQKAAQLTEHHDTGVLDILAEAYAIMGKYDTAIHIAQNALELALKESDQQGIRHFQQRLDTLQHQRSIKRQGRPPPLAP